jgi:tmRNA-binding protein
MMTMTCSANKEPKRRQKKLLVEARQRIQELELQEEMLRATIVLLHFKLTKGGKEEPK